MLNVIIELWPFGDKEQKRTLGEFQIANDGTGSMGFGNYLYRTSSDEEWQTSVQAHPRNEPVEKLIYKVLKEKFGE